MRKPENIFPAHSVPEKEYISEILTLYNDGKTALTQLGDAAHPGCKQRLLQCAELSLGVSMTLSAPPGALLVPVQVQTLRQAQHT